MVAKTKQSIAGARALPSFTNEQAAKWRDTCGVKMTDNEFSGIVEFARARDLNPFAGHFSVSRRKGKLVTVTTIDGFRAIAAKTGELDGQSDPEWIDRKGQWHEVWAMQGSPVAARIRIYRKGCTHPFTGIAHHADYSQGDQMWWGKSGGAHMIAKCAEALALRKAFPESLASIFTDDEMDQAANDSEPAPVPRIKKKAPAAVKKPKAKKAAPSEHVLVRMANVRTMAEYTKLGNELRALDGDEKKIALSLRKLHLPHIESEEFDECNKCSALVKEYA